jgi:hypothetical protein
MNRWKTVWRLIHHGEIDEGPVPNDIDEARRALRTTEQGLAQARKQTPEVERVTRSLRANQNDLDFTELVEEAFSQRRRGRT